MKYEWRRDSRARRPSSGRLVACTRRFAGAHSGAFWAPAKAVSAVRRGRRGVVVEPAQPDLLEGPGDPVAFIRLGLEAAALHQGVGVLVPGAVGEIVPEHGGSGLCFFHDAERHVALGEPQQRLFDMARGLILRDHYLEAVDGADEVLL